MAAMCLENAAQAVRVGIARAEVDFAEPHRLTAQKVVAEIRAALNVIEERIARGA
jgi:hypothetical protein